MVLLIAGSQPGLLPTTRGSKPTLSILRYLLLEQITNKFSYYPRSTCDWNNLLIDTIESQSLETFLGNYNIILIL